MNRPFWKLCALATLVLAGVLVTWPSKANAGKVDKSCTFKGKRLLGKIKVVDSFPDLKVQVVSSFPDVKVQKVTSFPIVLIGSSYWQGLLDWLRDTVLAEGKINAADLEMVTVTDDVDEAVGMMVKARANGWPTPPPERAE